MTPQFKIVSAVFLLSCLLTSKVLAQDKVCNPAPTGAAVLRDLPSKIKTVEGVLAEFDPCHRSVNLRTPFFSKMPPLMIVVHGGGGLDSGTQNAADAFRSKGFATLVFDAFELNGFYQGPQFWASAATNESRQRMIYKAALGAYEWAIQSNKVDTRQIFFHGLSNGAAVVANLAAVVDPQHVKALFAEGIPGNGIGLPDKLKAPLKVVFGKLDNYGGRTASEWIWTRQEPCIGNAANFIRPEGNSRNCNRFNNPGGLTQQPIDWFESQKAQGADIELWWLEDTAHGTFIGPLTKNMRTYSNDSTRYAWVGGSHNARDDFLKKIAALTNK
jgi:hypothetical protein